MCGFFGCWLLSQKILTEVQEHAQDDQWNQVINPFEMLSIQPLGREYPVTPYDDEGCPTVPGYLNELTQDG